MTENEAIEELKYCIEPNQGFMECRYASRKANVLAIKALEEIQQYRSIGTVEECREAVERYTAKKPIKRQLGNTLVRKIYHCPNCNKRLYDCAFKNGELDHVSPGSRKCKYCDCGQAISWEESEGEDD